MTEDIIALRVSNTGAGTASDGLLAERVGELEREGTELKARIATADGLAVQLQERNVGLSTHVDNLNTALATSWTEVESLNGKLMTVRDELTTVSDEDVRSVDI